MTHALPLHGVVTGSLALAAALSLARASAAGSPAAAASTPGVGAVIERVRRATGWPVSLAREDLVVSGRIAGAGGRSGFTWRFGDHGRFLREVTGTLAKQVGGDADSSWILDAGSRTRALEFADDENARLLSRVLSGQWLAPNSGVEITAGPDSSDGLDRLYLTLGRRRALLAIDRQNGEPRELALRPSYGGETWVFSDYRKDGGFAYPRQIEQRVPAGDADRLAIDSVERPHAAPVSVYARPAGGGDAHFDPSVASELHVERSTNGFLLVYPKINGRDVGAFIFDTGAGANVITPALAESLGLEKAGNSWLGMAAGAAPSALRRAESIQLGPLTIDHPVLLEMDLAAVSAQSGAEIVGIIGYDVLMRSVVEIEVAHSRIAVHDGNTFADPALRWEPIAISGNHAHVRGNFEGHEGWFRLDTGAPQVAVILNGPTVADLKVLEGRETQQAKIGVPGGTMDVALGTIATLTIGGHTFEKLSTLFPLGSGGAFDDIYTLGNLGQECLKPFRAVFDYRNRRVALQELPAPSGSTAKD